jgi:NitT/TauT family transport system substrate-binding protein
LRKAVRCAYGLRHYFRQIIGAPMSKINIQFTLFSAFYSPLISTMTGGFLKDEGLDYEWSVAEPGVTAITALDNGSADVVQSTLSQGFNTLNKGETPTCVHFAQINEMDGFFITGRDAEPDFSWNKLEGAEVLVHHGGQPMTMFKYACYKAGIDINKINIIDAGSGGEMDAAFRAGTGQYIHQQGPAPQQLAADGIGHVVAQLGPVIGACGFSSLAANPAWLATDEAKAFTRAYIKTRNYMNDTSAAEIASAQKPLFPKIDEAVLADCIGTYQAMGCWTRHIDITQDGYDAMLDIFAYDGKLPQRYGYDQVCTLPPAI